MSFIQRYFFILLFFVPLALRAQQELMLYQMPDVWRANTLNPAFFPDSVRYVIGLPSYSLDAAFSGDLTYNDIFRKEDGNLVVDLDDAIGKLGPENYIVAEQRIETVNFGMRLPKGFTVMAGHSMRLSATVDFPKTFAEVYWYGNGPYVGQTMDLGLGSYSFDWHEIMAGGSKTFGTVTVGARAKFIGGNSALQTDPNRNQADIYTDPDYYQLTINSDYAFYSSSIFSSIDTAGLGFELVTENFRSANIFKNQGWAFDLGVHARVGERLTLSASALDLGGTITWTEQAYEFYSNGSYTYDGVYIPGKDIINGSDSLDIDGELDTLNDIFKFVRTDNNFTSKLPQRYYVGGQYQLLPQLSVGANYFHQSGEFRSLNAVGAQVMWQALTWLRVGGMYGVTEINEVNVDTDYRHNVGFQAYLQFAPFQFYVVTDNLVGAFTPRSSSAANLGVGLSLAFR
jgi:Family of unknown function (DUF5723)